jgi:bifunctional DNA-binding transcriptional regulator/antitoxin component of YhaV-PrlF toxin-antitoxin module
MDTRQQTLVSKRSQTVIPVPIRKRYSNQEGNRLVWINDGQVIKAIPVPADPIRALRGRGQGENLLESLMQYRKEECERES